MAVKKSNLPLKVSLKKLSVIELQILRNEIDEVLDLDSKGELNINYVRSLMIVIKKFMFNYIAKHSLDICKTIK